MAKSYLFISNAISRSSRWKCGCFGSPNLPASPLASTSLRIASGSGRRPDPDAVRKLVLESGEIGKFRDPNQPHFYPEDLEIALEMNKYDFAVRIRREDDLLVARREP